jgi:hypothetical protein
VPRFVFRLFRRRNLGKGPTDKLQLFYGIAVLSLLVVYTGILLVAAYQLVLQAPSLVGGASSLPSITTPQVLAIGMALAGALFPKPKEQFSNAAVDLVATMRY